MTLWETLRRAFDEGRDEEENGAPVEPLLDLMMLAARADRVIDADERLRITNLLTKHWHAFTGQSDDALAEKIERSVARLDAMGRVEDQISGACEALTRRGVRATENGYSLAYAVLLAGGINAKERAFTRELTRGLEISEARRASLEASLDDAASLGSEPT